MLAWPWSMTYDLERVSAVSLTSKLHKITSFPLQGAASNVIGCFFFWYQVAPYLGYPPGSELWILFPACTHRTGELPILHNTGELVPPRTRVTRGGTGHYPPVLSCSEVFLYRAFSSKGPPHVPSISFCRRLLHFVLFRRILRVTCSQPDGFRYTSLCRYGGR